MIAVGVVEMPVDEVVAVIAVGYLIMAAVGSVLVGAGVRATVMLGRAVSGVPAVDLDRMLLDMIAMRVMEVTVVQVVDMTVMFNREVTAVRTVSMIVAGVGGMLRRAHTSTVRQGFHSANWMGMRSTLRQPRNCRRSIRAGRRVLAAATVADHELA